MKKKSIFCMFLTVVLILGLMACSSSGSSAEVGAANMEEDDTVESETDAETGKEDNASETEESGQEGATGINNTARKTDEEMAEELFASIEEAVRTGYLEPNGIAPEDFVWPEYYFYTNERGEGDLVDEDRAWTYFSYIWMDYSLFGEMYSADDMNPSPKKEETKQLMNCVLDGIVNWYERPENNHLFISSVEDLLSDYTESIPANVHFTD